MDSRCRTCGPGTSSLSTRCTVNPPALWTSQPCAALRLCAVCLIAARTRSSRQLIRLPRSFEVFTTTERVLLLEADQRTASPPDQHTTVYVNKSICLSAAYIPAKSTRRRTRSPLLAPSRSKHRDFCIQDGRCTYRLCAPCLSSLGVQPVTDHDCDPRCRTPASTSHSPKPTREYESNRTCKAGCQSHLEPTTITHTFNPQRGQQPHPE